MVDSQGGRQGEQVGERDPFVGLDEILRNAGVSQQGNLPVAMPQQVPAPTGRGQARKIVTVTFPYRPETGIIRVEVVRSRQWVDEDGELRDEQEQVVGHAYADDGRIIKDVGDFNRSPHSGVTHTNDHRVKCPGGCGNWAYSREMTPSQIDPKVWVCPDCIREGV